MDAAKRLEEGIHRGHRKLEVRLTGLLEVSQYANDTRGPGILVLYRGQILGGEPCPGDDADEVGFFGPDELPDNIAFVSNRRALARWREERGRKA